MERNENREILLALFHAEPMTALTWEQWQAVVILAQQHGVAPLLYWKVKSLALDTPADIMQSLRAAYLSSANRNLRLYHQLATVLKALQQANIPVIPLKGAYLAERIYGNIALRPMGDVDLLVRKMDVPKVKVTLLQLNYLQLQLVEDAIAETYHLRYEHAESGLHIEIHWNLIESHFGICVDTDALWEHSRPANISGIAIREMVPEDQVLHLCIHTAKHSSIIGMRAMCDLAETLRYYQTALDWECLKQRTFQWKAERCVYIYLQLAKELFDAPVSENWLKALKPLDFDPIYLAHAREQLLVYVEETEEAFPSSSGLVRIWMSESVPRKMGLLWQGIFPSRKVLALIYPAPPDSWRIFLYYPVRIINLLQRDGRVAWKLLQRNPNALSRAKREEQSNALQSWLLAR